MVKLQNNLPSEDVHVIMPFHKYVITTEKVHLNVSVPCMLMK